MRPITASTLTPFALLFLTSFTQAFLYPTQISNATSVDPYSPSIASGDRRDVPMVQVVLVQQARMLTRRIAAKNPPTTPKTIFPSESALDDPDFVPTEDNDYEQTVQNSMNHFPEGNSGQKIQRRPPLEKRQGDGSPHLFDQLQRKVNVDGDGNILFLFPSVGDQMLEPASTDRPIEPLEEFPMMRKKDTALENKWRPWRGSNVYNWKRHKQPAVTRGKWNVRYDGRVNAYKKTYDWKHDNQPEVRVEARAVQKRDPEPAADPEPMADLYSETGLALSITSPIDVLRERIRMDNERNQRRRAHFGRGNKDRHKNLQKLG
ncbi:hypothetical protein RvY_16408 [Ramazzottius varieornatus]|uniref:Corticotropin-releasing factor domain-containing protein n=1 Tax=Ramazzottius varieornatus TaxID=947166 RepID=A0A1D1VZL9_RAMVA|nr:hypothetical protein RvY_16408 [Ramazzottius varieornatus]